MAEALSRLPAPERFKNEEVETILKVAEDKKTWELIEELECSDNKEWLVRRIFPTPQVVNPTDRDVIQIGCHALMYDGRAGVSFARVVAGIRWHNFASGTDFMLLLIANKDYSGGKHQGVALVAHSNFFGNAALWFKNIKTDDILEEASNSFFKEQGFDTKEVETILEVAQEEKTRKLMDELEYWDYKEMVIRRIFLLPVQVNPSDPHVIEIGKYAVSCARSNPRFVRVIYGIRWITIGGSIYELRIETKDDREVPRRDIGLVARSLIGRMFLMWFKKIF